MYLSPMRACKCVLLWPEEYMKGEGRLKPEHDQQAAPTSWVVAITFKLACVCVISCKTCVYPSYWEVKESKLWDHLDLRASCVAVHLSSSVACLCSRWRRLPGRRRRREPSPRPRTSHTYNLRSHTSWFPSILVIYISQFFSSSHFPVS